MSVTNAFNNKIIIVVGNFLQLWCNFIIINYQIQFKTTVFLFSVKDYVQDKYKIKWWKESTKKISQNKNIWFHKKKKISKIKEAKTV